MFSHPTAFPTPGSTIIITSFSAKQAPASETGALPGEKSQLGSKVTARQVLVSNRVGKRPDAAEHGRSLNGCKPPKPSQVTKHLGSRDEGVEEKTNKGFSAIGSQRAHMPP